MDQATPNLPSSDFDVTSNFYSLLGFVQSWRDDGWMILNRGELTLEFFPHSDLKPQESWFSCCLRLDNLTLFYQVCIDAGVPQVCWGQPRIQPPQKEESGLTIGALIDPDGTLLRLIQN